MHFKQFFVFGKKTGNEKVSEEMLERMGFGRDVLEILNQAASRRLQPLKANGVDGEGGKMVGVSFSVPWEQAEEVVINLQSQVKGLGFFAFITERDFQSRNNSSIGIIKSEDPFEILKIFQTNGENYDISNEDVVSRLKHWNRRYPFSIIGAGLDWVEVVFVEELPNQEMSAFAQEIYEFCPDITEQEEESLEGLMTDLKDSNKLFLWWD